MLCNKVKFVLKRPVSGTESTTKDTKRKHRSNKRLIVSDPECCCYRCCCCVWFLFPFFILTMVIRIEGWDTDLNFVALAFTFFCNKGFWQYALLIFFRRDNFVLHLMFLDTVWITCWLSVRPNSSTHNIKTVNVLPIVTPASFADIVNINTIDANSFTKLNTTSAYELAIVRFTIIVSDPNNRDTNSPDFVTSKYKIFLIHMLQSVRQEFSYKAIVLRSQQRHLHESLML